MLIVLAGSIGRFPVGGHAWVDMHYLLGLRELGHDVVYLEECGPGSWVYHWETEKTTTDLDYPTDYVRDCLAPIGFGDRWIYRAGDESVGMPLEAFREICSRADLLIVRAVSLDLWRPEYDWPRRRVFIDADPPFTQIRVLNGHHTLAPTVAACDHHFTVGLNVGGRDCDVPAAGYHWRPMLPPVALSHWPRARREEPRHFTTIMQWRSYREVEYDGVRYGNKDIEFPRYLDLPKRTEQPFLIALTGAPPTILPQHGWETVPGWRASATPDSYLDFVAGSRAEFSVAKHGYVASRCGWFSDRSACYLASGRPVLIQDVGLPGWLRSSGGIHVFSSPEEVVAGVDAINANYASECQSARRTAEEHFDAGRVLESLLVEAMD